MVDAGFVTDYSGLIEKMHGRTYAEALDSFGFPALMPVLNVCFFFLYDTFGKQSSAWHWAHVVSYSYIAWEVYNIASRLLFAEKDKTMIATLMVTILYFLSPFHVEAMAWKVCLGHILSTGLLLTSFRQYLMFDSSLKRYHLILAAIFQILSLLTFEWALIMPLILLAVFWKGIWKRIDINENSIGVLIASIVSVLYILLTKVIIGDWIGHYGADAVLTNNPVDQLGVIGAYFVKHLSFIHFANYGIRSAAYEFVRSPIGIVLFTMVMSVFLFLLRGKRKIDNWQIAMLAVIGFIPVSGFSFNYLTWSENDRYGILGGLFLIILFVRACYRFTPIVRWTLLGMALLVSAYFQQRMIINWDENASVVNELMSSFECDRGDRVFILNFPDNINGTLAFRNYAADESLSDALKWIEGKSVPCDIIEVMQYNMINSDDGVKCEVVDPATIKVSFNQWGTWWWRRGLGASNHDNDIYSATLGDGHYLLKVKKSQEGDRFYYQMGSEWKSIKSGQE